MIAFIIHPLHRLVFALAACLVALGSSARVHAEDVVVNTEGQMAGVAPRIELEAGINFYMGFGSACRSDNDGMTSPTRHCTSLLPTGGGQVLALLRPWNHVAIGPTLAFDAKLGRKRFTLSDGDADYHRQNWRLALEARWYARRVAVGGMFISVLAGVGWFGDSISPATGSDASATQTAPLIGLGLGGAFLPYRGLGMTLALESYIAFLPSEGPRLNDTSTAYGYGTYAFAGLTLNLATSLGL
ncbi:MAG TPA: hypothetical protein VGI70_09490 [Polyangiales bacterium]